MAYNGKNERKFIACFKEIHRQMKEQQIWSIYNLECIGSKIWSDVQKATTIVVLDDSIHGRPN